MAISAERRAELIRTFGTDEKDTGSAQVQVALLTEDIRDLTEHLKEHKHDFSTRRGLLQKVSRRNRLSAYLKRKDREAYLDLIGRLGLRK
jgi:small subunit ribosomal protein S15